MSKEAMKLALEALETCTPEDTSTGHVIYAWHDEELVNKAIKSLEEALAGKQEQPKVRTGNCLLTGVCASEGHKIQAKQEQGEPVKLVAYNCTCGTTMKFESKHGIVAPQPAQKPWVGLTDEEMAEIERNSITRRQAIRAIEAKLKEKNT